MSDTITPEERALWASTAAARINAVTPERQCEITAQERLVKALKAIEQTEARAEKAEAENARLRELVGALDELKNAEKNFIRLQQTKRESDEGWRPDVDCAAIKTRFRAARVRFATAIKAVEAARRAVAAGEG